MKTMKYDDNLEKRLTAFFGIIGNLAILINLHYKGYTSENILDAIKDIAGLIVAISVFILANRIRNRAKSFLDSGINALSKIQIQNNDFLLGPEYDKTDYNPEENTKSQRMKYLFFKPTNKYNRKVAFIPLEPIEQGILDIRISKATLVICGFDSKDPNIEKNVENLKQKVYNSIEELIKNSFKEQYIILNEGESRKLSKYQNSAIVIDFEEEKLKFKGLEKAIFFCVERALNIIKENKIS